MRISDWSSDVCSSDLFRLPRRASRRGHSREPQRASDAARSPRPRGDRPQPRAILLPVPRDLRSEEHTSELQSLMRISYAVFCLKKKKKKQKKRKSTKIHRISRNQTNMIIHTKKQYNIQHA